MGRIQDTSGHRQTEVKRKQGVGRFLANFEASKADGTIGPVAVRGAVLRFVKECELRLYLLLFLSMFLEVNVKFSVIFKSTPIISVFLFDVVDIILYCIPPCRLDLACGISFVVYFCNISIPLFGTFISYPTHRN